MDKYEQLAEAFEMEELEERIEFYSCDFQSMYNTCKDWANSVKSYVSGNDGC